MTKILKIGCLSLLIIILLIIGIWAYNAKRGLFIIPSSFIEEVPENCEEEELLTRNLCYARQAVEKRDPTLCEKIVIRPEDPTAQQNYYLCYKNLSRWAKDISLCEKTGPERSNCILEYAVQFKDKSICDRLENTQAGTCRNEIDK